jgi:hypothetical protein
MKKATKFLRQFMAQHVGVRNGVSQINKEGSRDLICKTCTEIVKG